MKIRRKVPVSGAVISEIDKNTIREVIDKEWFTEGVYSARFANALKKRVGSRFCILVNSGSSANLVATFALKDKYIPYNEDAYLVITPATAFPTTVAPIVQAGLVPYFVDSNPATLNVYTDQIVELLRNPQVLGFSAAHTLGFTYDAKLIREKCDEYNKFFLEDCADALGSADAGLYGHISTFSFFPAHNITTGEGGAAITNQESLNELLVSYRDWGRDCWCLPGQNNSCGKRFEQEFSGLPENWDHKYTFTKVGFNLKMTDLQAALGLSQMDRLGNFTDIRRKNFYHLSNLLEDMPEVGSHLFYRTHLGNDSPFGFPITVTSREFTKQEIVDSLEAHGVKTRPVFAGNITRQPMSSLFYFEADHLGGSDYIMNHTFWVGCWHGLGTDDMEYIADVISDFLSTKGIL